MSRRFIAGPNFSGRSAMVAALARERDAPSFFIGPYAEAALSGLTSTVADEVALYRAAPPVIEPPPLDVSAFAHRKPQSLSGGEQVLLALHCFTVSGFKTIAIDTALEQLDRAHRAEAFACFDRAQEAGLSIILTDNRCDASLPGWDVTKLPVGADRMACDPVSLAAALPVSHAPSIAIDDLSFGYDATRMIFKNASARMSPGRIYRLTGQNGAGKSTLLKLLAGVLKPQRGAMLRDSLPYQPWRGGNALIALAPQNPDHQWCGATLREDLSRRLRATPERAAIDAAKLAECAAALGVTSLDQHLYELPLAARKRLGWLWPLLGIRPWVVLDEPTVGQDRETRTALAQAMTLLSQRGHGVIVVTHDEDFAAGFAHQTLTLRDGAIAQQL